MGATVKKAALNSNRLPRFPKANLNVYSFGGIAYHHISDTYIALFSHFIPCGVWEAVHILDGLLKNTSDILPAEGHADRP